MSRPTASVPSRCGPNNQSGGRSTRARFWPLGSYGEIHGANAPTMIRITTIMPPTRTFALSHGRIAARSRRGRAERGGPTTSASRVALLCKADPRVDKSVEDIDREIDGDERDRVGEHGAGDQRVIPRLDRRDQQRAAARPCEHRLDDDRSAEQRAELESDHRDDRNQRVAKYMPPENRAFADALRPCRAYIVLVHDLEHGRARHPH